jgi:hypothetical protein
LVKLGPDADGRERGVPIRVALEAGLVAMLGPVDFDGELEARAEEVEREGSGGCLSPEPRPEICLRRTN